MLSLVRGAAIVALLMLGSTQVAPKAVREHHESAGDADSSEFYYDVANIVSGTGFNPETWGETSEEEGGESPANHADNEGGATNDDWYENLISQIQPEARENDAKRENEATREITGKQAVRRGERTVLVKDPNNRGARRVTD